LKVIGTKQPALRKRDDRYEIFDLQLEDFTLSTTTLNPGKSTVGHSHPWEEAYYVIKACGRILIGETTQIIKHGYFITIPGGEFHRVYNGSRKSKLVFLCIFKSQN